MASIDHDSKSIRCYAKNRSGFLTREPFMGTTLVIISIVKELRAFIQLARFHYIGELLLVFKNN
jgi:hypothetical protein